jgi:hypothetical protein
MIRVVITKLHIYVCLTLSTSSVQAFELTDLTFTSAIAKNTSCITVLFVGETDAPESLPVSH